MMMRDTSGGLGRLVALIIACAATAPLAWAQAPVPMTGTPRVLSTEATTPAGMASPPGSMSGMPLQVGDLPPGSIAVRVVHPPYRNIAGQAVELRVGVEGRPMHAVTGDDGRAQFDGVSVGEHVMAVALVDGERLASQLFAVPGDGGVRVLLATSETSSAAAVAPAAAPVAPPATRPAKRSRAPLVLTGVFALIGGALFWGRRPRRRAQMAPVPADASRTALAARRERLHADLVRLELEHAQAPQEPRDDERRTALLAEIRQVHAALGEAPPMP